MAINRPNVGEKTDYEISAITELDDNRGFLLSFKKDGRTLLSRMYVSVADAESYHVGDTLTLVPWSMEIIPVQKKRDDGTVRTYRTLQGLAWDETDAEAAARRSAQNMYDSAEKVAYSRETVTAAQKANCFVNFVDRNKFIEMLDGAS